MSGGGDAGKRLSALQDRLGHRFDDQHPRHQRTSREMPLELGFIQGDVLDGNRFLSGNVVNDTVHQGKRVAMGQQSQDLFRIQQGLGWAGVGGGGRSQITQS